MPSDTPQERAKKNKRNNPGNRKGLKVTVSIKPVKRKPRKR